MKMAQNEVDTWREKYTKAQFRIMELEQQVVELQNKLNALHGTSAQQHYNTAPNNEQLSNNNVSIVRTDNISVGSVPYNGYQSVADNNGYESVDNTEGLDAKSLVADIMRRYKIQTSN